MEATLPIAISLNVRNHLKVKGSSFFERILAVCLEENPKTKMINIIVI